MLPKDIKMPAATLAYSQYTYHQMPWWDRSLVPLELNRELHTLARTATADSSRLLASSYLEQSVVAVRAKVCSS